MDWTKENLHQLDTKTWKILTMNRMLHPKADVDRIYLPRKSGGRGLMSAEDTVQLESMNMQKYLLSKKDTLSEIECAGMKINQTTNEKSRQSNRMNKWHKKFLYGRFPKIVNSGAGCETQA